MFPTGSFLILLVWLWPLLPTLLDPIPVEPGFVELVTFERAEFGISLLLMFYTFWC